MTSSMWRTRNSAEGHKGLFWIISQKFYLYCKGKILRESTWLHSVLLIPLWYFIYSFSYPIWFFCLEVSGRGTAGMHTSEKDTLHFVKVSQLIRATNIATVQKQNGGQKVWAWMRDVNMNNKMKHVLVLDTINSSRNGRPMEAKRRWA